MRLRAAFDDADRVGAEFAAVRFAVDYAIGVWGSDASLTLAAGRLDVTDGQLRRAAAGIEVTFALRRFVQFEVVLRDYWTHGMGRRTRPDMRPLMDGIARHRQMSPLPPLAAAAVVRRRR